MLTTRKPLAELTAADVMSREVTTISEDLPLREAARLFLAEHISGAPVVAPDGRCIGVLSATDFIRWTEHQGDAESSVFPRSGSVRAGTPVPCWQCFCSDWQIINLDLLPDDAVRWHMTPDPVTAVPAAPIGELAQRMLDAHIHRVIVVDDQRRPVGIVASTDILAAVACLAAESAEERLCNEIQ